MAHKPVDYALYRRRRGDSHFRWVTGYGRGPKKVMVTACQDIMLHDAMSGTHESKLVKVPAVKLVH